MGAFAEKRIRRIPKSRRRDVTRGEFNALVDRLNERSTLLDSIHAEIQRALEIQFQRIAQLQVELDEVRKRNGSGKRTA